MPESWLPLEDRLAHWDPLAEQVRLTGWRPGPAGVSSLELAPGLRASVDHASPTTLTEVTVDADRGHIAADTFFVLTRLVGDHAADVLRRLPSEGPSDRPTPIRYARRSEHDEAIYQHDAQTWHVPLAQLLLTADLADDAGLSDVARAAALLDGVIPAMRLRLPILHDVARRGVGLLAQSAPRYLDPERSARLRSLLDFAQQLGEVPELDVQRARRRLDEGTAAAAAKSAAARRTRPLAAAAMPAAAPMLAESAAMDDPAPAPTGIPLPVDGDHRSWAWLDHGSNVQFRSAPSAAGAWGRVFRGSDRLLLGLAPLRPGDDGACTSLVVIPPVADPDRLVVDVVDDPAAQRRAPTHELARRAILTGRRAAHLSRLDDPAADAVWQDCAAQWSALGDVQRANLASRHGRRDDRSPGRGRVADQLRQPLLADQLP